MEKVNLNFQNYESPQLKRQKVFKYYNNSLIYISFRQKVLEKNSSLELSNMVQAQIKDTLFEKFQLKLELFKLYKSYVVFKMVRLSSPASPPKNPIPFTKLHAKVAKILSEFAFKTNPNGAPSPSPHPILVTEFLDHKKVFGKQASLEEMRRFKSKVKKMEEKTEEKKKEGDVIIEDQEEGKEK